VMALDTQQCSALSVVMLEEGTTFLLSS